MIMQSTTKRRATMAAALSLGLLLSGPLAMAAEAPTPTATPSVASPADGYPHHWTAEQRQQHWENVQQGARDLWAKWAPTPEQRQHYWEQVKRGWHDLVAMISPSAETPPTAPVIAGVAPAPLAVAPAAAAASAVTAVAPAAAPVAAVVPAAAAVASSVAPVAPAAAAVAPSVREVVPAVAPVAAVVPAAALAPEVIPSTPLPIAATSPPAKSLAMWTLWSMTPEQRREYWLYMQRGSQATISPPPEALPTTPGV